MNHSIKWQWPAAKWHFIALGIDLVTGWEGTCTWVWASSILYICIEFMSTSYRTVPYLVEIHLRHIRTIGTDLLWALKHLWEVERRSQGLYGFICAAFVCSFQAYRLEHKHILHSWAISAEKMPLEPAAARPSTNINALWSTLSPYEPYNFLCTIPRSKAWSQDSLIKF